MDYRRRAHILFYGLCLALATPSVLRGKMSAQGGADPANLVATVLKTPILLARAARSQPFRPTGPAL